MSSVSLPVTRPTGRALLVGSVDCRQGPLGLLQDIGYVCVEADDPYSALVELSRKPQNYQAMILSLQSVFREELCVIATVKRRFPQVEIWLTDTDGRQAAMADAMRLGADGLLGDDGLHRVATAATVEAPARASKRSSRAGRSRRNRRNGAQTEITARPLAPLAVAPLPRPVAITSNGPSTVSAISPEADAAAHSPGPQRPTNGEAAEHPHSEECYDESDCSCGDAVLTAEELRALLHEPQLEDKGRK